LATSRAALATPTAATAPTSAARRGAPSRGRSLRGARWRRKWRRIRLAGRCSEKRRGRRHRLLHVEFSKAQVCANVAEGRKRLLASDQLCHELKPFVEAAQDVQDERAVTDGLAKISKGISLGLHLAAVVVDGEGALREVAKFSIKDECPGFAISQELIFDPEPRCPGSGASVLVDDVQKVGGDGVENPGDDHAVHARPCRIVGAGVIAEDMVLQREPPEGEEEVAAPLGVVR
jgi:hypothetical protein